MYLLYSRKNEVTRASDHSDGVGSMATKVLPFDSSAPGESH
jgi:hypothetical protein